MLPDMRERDERVTEAMLSAGAALIDDAFLEVNGPCPPFDRRVAAQVYTAMRRAKYAQRRGGRQSDVRDQRDK